MLLLIYAHWVVLLLWTSFRVINLSRHKSFAEFWKAYKMKGSQSYVWLEAHVTFLFNASKTLCYNWTDYTAKVETTFWDDNLITLSFYFLFCNARSWLHPNLLFIILIIVISSSLLKKTKREKNKNPQGTSCLLSSRSCTEN